jgi:DNA-binding protein WhiA
MSFSAGIKEEMAGLAPGRPCCMLSELAGMARASGSMHLAGDGLRAEVATESPAIARRAYRFMKALYGASPAIERHERHRLNRNFSYRVVLADSTAARRMLTDIGVLGEPGAPAGIRPELVRLSCCEGAFLRGLFLGCGSISDPGKGYRLEFVLEDEQFARGAAALLAGADIEARVVPRGGRQVAYVKDAEGISAFLALTGAHAGMLRFEGVRVEKNVRNAANRLVNCDTANADKTVRASGRQLESIRLIETRGELGGLARGLREAARARMENPDATLERLAEVMGTVSKSGLNNRFRRIDKIAGEIRRREETGDEPEKTDDPQR